MTLKKVCFLGADLFGATTSSAIALKCPDIEVTVMDEDISVITHWNLNRIQKAEPGVEENIKKCRNKNLFFVAFSKVTVKQADLIFVGTNSFIGCQEDGNSWNENSLLIEKYARFIASSVDTPKIVVERSILNIRVAETLCAILNANKLPNATFQVVSNPLFLFEGNILKDILEPQRIVIGGAKSPEGVKAAMTVASLYENWVPKEKIIVTDICSAELSRLFTNALMAQKISSINSLLDLCEVTNADIREIINILGMDCRIGHLFLDSFLNSSSTFFHKDVTQLVNQSKILNLPEVASYWQRILDVNQYQKRRLVMKIFKCFHNSLLDKKIAIFGLLGKGKNPSVYDSPAFYTCKMLIEESAQLKIYDSISNSEKIKEDFKKLCSTKVDPKKLITIVDSPYEATSGSHGILIFSAVNLLKDLNFKKIYKSMIKPASIFDAERILLHDKLKEIGFIVCTVGKKC